MEQSKCRNYFNMLNVVYGFSENELEIMNIRYSGSLLVIIEICIPDTFFILSEEWTYVHPWTSMMSFSEAKNGSSLTPLPECLCPGPRVARRGMDKTVGLPFFEILFNIRQTNYCCIGCFSCCFIFTTVEWCELDDQLATYSEETGEGCALTLENHQYSCLLLFNRKVHRNQRNVFHSLSILLNIPFSHQTST